MSELGLSGWGMIWTASDLQIHFGGPPFGGLRGNSRWHGEVGCRGSTSTDTQDQLNAGQGRDQKLETSDNTWVATLRVSAKGSRSKKCLFVVFAVLHGSKFV